MNRRGFLASLLGLAVAPIAGALPAQAPLDVAGWSVLEQHGDIWMSRAAWLRHWKRCEQNYVGKY